MADLNPGDGNAERLRRYWSTGPGGQIKIRWGTPGDWRRCVVFLSEHMSPEQAQGYCANLHKRNTGMYPGDSRNK